MHRIDGPGATADNKFTKGNPTTGTQATRVTADFMNAIQEEIIAVLTAAGLAPIKTDNTQLRQAIVSLISGGGVAVTAAGVTVVDAGDFFTTNNVEAALQQIAAKLYAGTLSASQVRRTVVALNGAAFQTDAAHIENLLEVSNAAAVTYTVAPDATYNAPIGAAITVVQAGAGKVSFVAGAGVTIKKPAVFNAATLGQDASAVLYKVAANTWRLGGMLEAA